MKIYQYRDYEEYRANQIRANVTKLKNIWALESVIISFIENATRLVKEPNRVLCHGSRNGTEVQYFKKHLPDAIVLGTDISHTATDFPNQIVWDFQKRRKSWVGRWDLIYTNSFDHAMDPKKTLEVWKEQLTPTGVIAIEHSIWLGKYNNKPHPVDCLDISFDELVGLFEEIGMVKIFEQDKVYKNADIYETKHYIFEVKK